MDKRTQDRIDKVKQDAAAKAKQVQDAAERKAKLIEEIAMRNEQARKERILLRARLEDEHDVNRPHIPQHKRDLLWDKAWEHGHATGLSGVAGWYGDLVDLIT